MKLILLSLLQFVLVKQVEKLDVTIHEYNVRIEELNRTIIDITSHKTRLSQVMNDLKPVSFSSSIKNILIVLFVVSKEIMEPKNTFYTTFALWEKHETDELKRNGQS